MYLNPSTACFSLHPSSIYIFIYLLMHSFIHPWFIYLSFDPSNQPFIPLFTCSFNVFIHMFFHKFSRPTIHMSYWFIKFIYLFVYGSFSNKLLFDKLRIHPFISFLPFTSLSIHELEKEMATHCSVLAWRIPGTEEPDGLSSMGSHRVGHDWSDLAATAAAASSHSWIDLLIDLIIDVLIYLPSCSWVNPLMCFTIIFLRI